MKKSTITLLSIAVVSMLLWSCTKYRNAAPASPIMPATPYAYSANSKDKIAVLNWLGNHSGPTVVVNVKPTVSIADISNAGVSLGRVVFYDNITSLNLANNCSHCHAAPPHILSPSDISIATIQTGGRPAPNAKYAMSDRAGQTAEDILQCTAHSGVASPDVMVSRMTSRGYYAQLFKDAYGTSEITTERINEALAQYIAAMAGHSSAESLAADVRFADPFHR